MVTALRNKVPPPLPHFVRFECLLLGSSYRSLVEATSREFWSKDEVWRVQRRDFGDPSRASAFTLAAEASGCIIQLFTHSNRMSALFNFQSLLLVILLVICTCTYVQAQTHILDRNKTGVLGIFWKAARIGERLSPYVSLACLFMGISLLLPASA
ncbi:hypothetical protein B0O80DRAFT_428003 [Mortierella sp. GBAus27b]|nr:hypothetical protein B0O80DRAFT_428003 [Mortierella sp. GBAus27b]